MEEVAFRSCREQVYSFYLSPFTEDGVLSLKIESFQRRWSPFTEDGVLSQNMESFHWRLSPFTECGVLSRNKESFHRIWSPFTGWRRENTFILTRLWNHWTGFGNFSISIICVFLFSLSYLDLLYWSPPYPLKLQSAIGCFFAVLTFLIEIFYSLK